MECFFCHNNRGCENSLYAQSYKYEFHLCHPCRMKFENSALLYKMWKENWEWKRRGELCEGVPYANKSMMDIVIENPWLLLDIMQQSGERVL